MFVPVAVLAALIVVPEPTLPELLAEYRAAGLPLPPAGARLVKCLRGVHADGRKAFDLAFEIDAGGPGRRPTLLARAFRWTPTSDQVTLAVERTPAGIRDCDLSPSDCLLAVQCEASGWQEFARHVLARSRAEDDPTPPRVLLAESAWAYWLDKVTEPKTDRRPVADRLRGLLRKYSLLDTDHHRALLRSLDLALVPSTARPGSIEAMIDALVDDGTDGSFGTGYTPGPAYWRLAEQGFDAVPALIAHLEDDRLTRGMMVGFNNFRSWHLRVGDVVGDLLEGLAGEELDRGSADESVGGGWLRRQQAWPVRPQAAREWWAKARAVGEEAHVTARVLSAPRPDSDENGVNELLLRVVRAKYTKRLPGLYRTVLAGPPGGASRALAEAVRKSDLPRAERVGLLAAAGGHKELKHRVPALRELKELDRPRFMNLLRATLDGLPADVPGAYWLAPQIGAVGLVIETDDPRAWAAAEASIARMPVGLRLELLERMGYPDDPRRTERLRLLRGFLDDDGIRLVTPGPRYQGPFAAGGYEWIEVRDFVAVTAGRLVGIDVPVNPKRTAAEWAEVRRAVAAKVERELGK